MAPDGLATRPTTDRVREAVFNALGSLDLLVGATVVDAFAGSGALGIEALSRGAASCTFLDTSGPAIRAVEANLRSTGLAGRARVVRAEATAFLAAADEPFDLALLDPPYAYDGWGRLLDVVAARFVVVESGHAIAVPTRWDVVRSKRYGGTVVTFARPAER